MDLITQTSLEALLMKATSSQNQNIDTAAVEAFCTLVNKEKDGAQIGVKVIANKIHCGIEKEVLQTLNILDCCMSKCGSHFQAEVGKFRFLNEMIKLVSPKYMGCQTPLIIKQKVLQLLYIWTIDFPKESKIKEAYDMLRKQGVIKEIPNPNVPVEASSLLPKDTGSIFQDEEKSKLLKKLLQSTNPEDIRAANWIIKDMVKENDKRVHIKSRVLSEIESAENNSKLLEEMLNSYLPGITSNDELDIMKQLFQSCKNYDLQLTALAVDLVDEEDMINCLEAIGGLHLVCEKFKGVVLEKKTDNLEKNEKQITTNSNVDLLDQSLCLTSSTTNSSSINFNSDVDVLSEIFNTPSVAVNSEILTPISINSVPKTPPLKISNPLDDLDILGDHYLKQSLNQGKQFQKSNEKVPMNSLLSKAATTSSQLIQKPEDLNNVNVNIKTEDLNCRSKVLNPNHVSNDSTISLVKIDCDETNKTSINDSFNNTDSKNKIKDSNENITKNETKLKDIHIKLSDIVAKNIPPLVLLDKNKVNIKMYFTENKPREDVSVFLVTTVNNNELPIDNFLFQPVVPKTCKIKMEAPSASNLPAFNWFLPPVAITQIILIANPENVHLSLKFVVSYSLDEETITEMGEVENLC